MGTGQEHTTLVTFTSETQYQRLEKKRTPTCSGKASELSNKNSRLPFTSPGDLAPSKIARQELTAVSSMPAQGTNPRHQPKAPQIDSNVDSLDRPISTPCLDYHYGSSRMDPQTQSWCRESYASYALQQRRQFSGLEIRPRTPTPSQTAFYRCPPRQWRDPHPASASDDLPLDSPDSIWIEPTTSCGRLRVFTWHGNMGVATLQGSTFNCIEVLAAADRIVNAVNTANSIECFTREDHHLVDWLPSVCSICFLSSSFDGFTPRQPLAVLKGKQVQWSETRHFKS